MVITDRYGEAANAALSAIADDNYVSRLERTIKAETGKFAVALCSVDAAIHTALHLCGVERGDYVLVPTFTYYSYITPVLHVGGVPVFLDCDPVTRCVSVQALDAALLWCSLQNKPPKAVIIDNAFGSVADYDTLAPLCSAYDVRLIELAVDAYRGRYKKTPCGANGSYGVIGFGKELSGGGSALVCDDDAARAEMFARIRYSDDESYDYGMSNAVAALNYAKIVTADKVIKRRKANQAALAAACECVVRPVDGDSGRYIMCKPSCGIEELREKGFNVKKPPPAHTLARYGDCAYFEHEPGYSVCASFIDHCFIDTDISASKRLQLARMIR